MDWQNLAQGKCPNCKTKLVRKGILDSVYHCHACGFKIREQRLVEILTPKKRTKSMDNTAAINNYNRKKIAEDFSDSPHLDY